ncbi:MAG: hypothetical protein ACRCWI_07005 [Brevinema sp.]
MLLVLFLFPFFLSDKILQEIITIPRYSIVYIFTNQHQINEVFFDHQKIPYQTNHLSNNSILRNTNTTKIVLIPYPQYYTTNRYASKRYQ